MISSSRKKTRLLHPHPLSGAGGRPSAVRQEIFLDVIAVGLEQHVGAAQLADLLFGALDHAVALARLRIEDLAGTGHLEALFSARFGLHLGHLALLIGGAGNRRRLRSTNDRLRDARADEHFAAATAALDQPGGGRAGYDRASPNLQIFQAITDARSGAERALQPPASIKPDAYEPGGYDSSEMSL